MTEDDRRKLYGSLLRGLAETAQEQLCAADRQHAWGEWRRFQVRHDTDDMPPSFDSAPTVCNRVVHIATERTCLCCGKVQRA